MQNYKMTWPFRTEINVCTRCLSIIFLFVCFLMTLFGHMGKEKQYKGSTPVYSFYIFHFFVTWRKVYIFFIRELLEHGSSVGIDFFFFLLIQDNCAFFFFPIGFTKSSFLNCRTNSVKKKQTHFLTYRMFFWVRVNTHSTLSHIYLDF